MKWNVGGAEREKKIERETERQRERLVCLHCHGSTDLEAEIRFLS